MKHDIKKQVSMTKRFCENPRLWLQIRCYVLSSMREEIKFLNFELRLKQLSIYSDLSRSFLSRLDQDFRLHSNLMAAWGIGVERFAVS